MTPDFDLVAALWRSVWGVIAILLLACWGACVLSVVAYWPQHVELLKEKIRARMGTPKVIHTDSRTASDVAPASSAVARDDHRDSRLLTGRFGG